MKQENIQVAIKVNPEAHKILIEHRDKHELRNFSAAIKDLKKRADKVE